MTAEDVKYSIERCAGINGDGTPLVEAFSNVDKVEIPDESTIDIYLKEADTEFLAYLTVAIVPEHVEDLEADPVGTGPFHYVSRSPQENIVLEKFSDYWDTENQAYLDKVTFRIVKDSNAVVTNLKSGTLDMYARLSSTQTAQLAEDSDFTIYDGGMNLVQALYLNNAVEPLNNVKVRQALCYAANRQEVLDMIADGKGTIIGSSMFPAFGKYYVPELSERYNQDIEKAKELLKEAGYPDGFELTITVPNNYQQHIDTAQLAFAAINVHLKRKAQAAEGTAVKVSIKSIFPWFILALSRHVGADLLRSYPGRHSSRIKNHQQISDGSRPCGHRPEHRFQIPTAAPAQSRCCTDSSFRCW